MKAQLDPPHSVPYMFSLMCRRSTPQKLIDERAFPVRVKVLIPELGLGARSETIYTWLDTHIARENYAHHAGGRTGLGDISHYYFRDTATAHQFARFLTELGLDLADGTTCITYSSPSLPFGR